MEEPDNLAPHKALIMGCNRGDGERWGGSPDHGEICLCIPSCYFEEKRGRGATQFSARTGNQISCTSHTLKKQKNNDDVHTSQTWISSRNECLASLVVVWVLNLLFSDSSSHPGCHAGIVGGFICSGHHWWCKSHISFEKKKEKENQCTSSFTV